MTIVLNATYDDPFEESHYSYYHVFTALLDDQEYMIGPCGARNDNGYPFTKTFGE